MSEPSDLLAVSILWSGRPEAFSVTCECGWEATPLDAFWKALAAANLHRANRHPARPEWPPGFFGPGPPRAMALPGALAGDDAPGGGA